MNDETRRKEKSAVDPAPEWHPYAVWQQRIRDAENGKEVEHSSVTGSWRTDAVWQNLIK